MVNDKCVQSLKKVISRWLMCLRFLLRSMTDVFEVLATVNDGSRSLTFWLRLSLLRCFLSVPHRPWDSQRCAPSPEALYKVFSQWREWSVTDEGLSSRGMVEAGSSSRTFLKTSYTNEWTVSFLTHSLLFFKEIRMFFIICNILLILFSLLMEKKKPRYCRLS